jgi:type II secretion system protein J
LRQSTGAFTLIEMVISGALMTIILASAYICLSAGVSSQKLVDSRSDAAQTARVAMALIAADLRSAVPLSAEYDFLGMHRELSGANADNLDFGTRNYIPKKMHESDFCEVSYYVERNRDKSMTLFRRRDSSPDMDPLSGGTREEIARGVQDLRFEYYDGLDWYEEWGDATGKKQTKLIPEPNMSGMPEAVRITLTVDPGFERKKSAEEKSSEAPLTLQTTARLNMAAFFYDRSGAWGTNNASGGSPQDSGGTGQ